MDEALLRQLLRQMKILNFWLTIGGTFILIAFLVTIYMLFKVFTFVQDTSDKITSIENKTKSTLNIQDQLCKSNSITSLLQNRSELCAK